MSAVSRNRPAPADRHEKINDASKAKDVRLAIIREVEGNALVCSCGAFSITHARVKVREDRAQKHLDKKHDGKGLWL